MNNQKKEILKTLKKELYPLTLRGKIEVVANLLLELGIAHSDIEENFEKINVKNVYNLVIQDVKKHGDTLPNSLARQALQMLLWLK